MLVVDASALFEVLAGAPAGEAVRAVMAAEDGLASPSLVDPEVLAVIQTQHRRGHLDDTAAQQAIDELREWPGERWPHGPLISRAWEFRANVRAYDGMYVALAEALDATLITLDHRLAGATGPRCQVLVPD